MVADLRRYMEKNRYDRAFDSLRRLRFSDVQAARDLYYAHKLLQVEHAQRSGRRSTFVDFFTVRRNRRAAQIDLTYNRITAVFQQQGVHFP